MTYRIEDFELPDPPTKTILQQINGPISLVASCVAVIIVVLALSLTVRSARHDTTQVQTSLASTEASLASTQTLLDSTTRDKAAATNALAAKAKEIADLKAVHLRAGVCIATHFEVEKVLINPFASHASVMAAIDRLDVCAGIGSLLDTDSTV